MALIKSIKGISPVFGSNCFLAENATILGDVVLGDNCSVWYNAVVRGDVHFIRIGNNVNIQDGAVIHCTYKKAPVNIGNNVSIAHNAIVHGCTIYDNVLIGMGAIIMDHVVVGSNSVIAAGAVVSKDTIIEPGSVTQEFLPVKSKMWISFYWKAKCHELHGPIRCMPVGTIHL